jgi:transposase
MPKDKSSPGLPDILGFITSLQEEKKKKLTKPLKKKVGRPAKYSDEAITKVSFVMLSKGIKEFKALWRYLKAHPQIRRKCGLKELPNRTTLMRRLKNFPPQT